MKKYVEEKRERFLNPAELKKFGEVLREMESEGIELPSAIAATRLLILTGCRLNAIMTLQWKHVDLPGKALRLPDSKTGAKVSHDCWLRRRLGNSRFIASTTVDGLSKQAICWETNVWTSGASLPLAMGMSGSVQG